MAPIIRAYLDEARGYAEAGIKPVKGAGWIWSFCPMNWWRCWMPTPELAEAFHALTPEAAEKLCHTPFVGEAAGKRRVARN